MTSRQLPSCFCSERVYWTRNCCADPLCWSSLIPGAMIPGVVIIEPDFTELKDAWPFLWYENEYVVDAASTFILAANAADALSQ